MSIHDIFYWVGATTVIVVGVGGAVTFLGWFTTWCIDKYVIFKNVRASFIEWHYEKLRKLK